MDILYLCDRKNCENCSPECKHTLDVSHAKNFEKTGTGAYVEKEHKPLLVLKSDQYLSYDAITNIRNEIKKQIDSDSSVIVVDRHITDVKLLNETEESIVVGNVDKRTIKDRIEGIKEKIKQYGG